MAVEHEGDRPWAAGSSEGEHQEQDQHLAARKPKHRHTGDDTVMITPLTVRRTRFVVADENGILNKRRSRCRAVKAVFSKVVDSVHIGHSRVNHLFARQRAVVVGVIDGEGLFILNINAGGVQAEGLRSSSAASASKLSSMSRPISQLLGRGIVAVCRRRRS